MDTEAVCKPLSSMVLRKQNLEFIGVNGLLQIEHKGSEMMAPGGFGINLAYLIKV
jgi:hypothetical protein